MDNDNNHGNTVEQVVYIVQDFMGGIIRVFFNKEDAELFAQFCINKSNHAMHYKVLVLRNGESFPTTYELCSRDP
jgi:hypothetical protein